MKLKYTLLFGLFAFLFGSKQEIKAQTQYGWSFRTECLTVIATYSGKPDSCLSVSWQAAGATYSGSSLTYKFAKPGTYQVCMKIKNSCKIWDTIICKSIIVDTCTPNPCLSFKPDFYWKSDCRTVKFLATSGLSNSTGVSYSWTWGDGGTGTGTDPSRTYVKDGVYKVCLKATWKVPGTTTVCVKEICKEIKISCTNPCKITGDFKITYGTGGQVKFEGSSNTGYYYTWKFGDGTTASGQNTYKWYKTPGTYEVCVTICDKTLKCCTTICKKVVIEEPCRIQGGFSFKNTGNGSFKFYGYSTDKGATYSWNFGDGTTGSGLDPLKTYTKSGVYNVCVTITSADKRCKITYCQKVTVVVETKRCSWSQAGFGIASTTTCAIVKVEAYNLVDTCISYKWTVNGVLTDSVGGRLKSITLPKNGTYTICLKLYNNCRKCDTMICKTVTVTCYKEPCNWKKAGAGFAYSVKCPNLVLEAYNLNNGCVKYAYTISTLNNVPLATFNGRVQTIGFSSNGDYNVCLKLTDTCRNCDTVICQRVTVNCLSPCNWKKAGAGYTYRVDCRTVTFTANNLNNGCVKYSWLSAGAVLGTGQTLSYKFSATGTYSICLKLADTCKKCDTTICQNILIDCTPCSATAYFKVDSISKAGIVYITNLSKGAYSYTWEFGDSTYSKLQSPVYHVYKFGGTRKICLTAWDSLGKCSTTYCITVQVVKTRSSQQYPSGSANPPAMRVYPNPADQTTTIVWNGSFNNLSVYSMSGKQVYKTSITGSQTTLHVSNLAPGIYTLQLTGADGKQTSRLVVERNP